MLRCCAVILLLDAATAAQADECDRVRLSAMNADIGLRHEKVLRFAKLNGSPVADFAVIAAPPGDPKIHEILLAANLAGTLPLACTDGPDLAMKPARTCDMSLEHTPLELVVTFTPDDAVGEVDRSNAVARYVLDDVLCRPN